MNYARIALMAASVPAAITLVIACSSDGTPAPSSSSTSSTSSSSSSSTSSSGAACVSGPTDAGSKPFGDSTCTADTQCAGGKCFMGGGGTGSSSGGGGRTFCTQRCCKAGANDSTCPVGDSGVAFCNNQGFCKY